jgi:hypothetical protein
MTKLEAKQPVTKCTDRYLKTAQIIASKEH